MRLTRTRTGHTKLRMYHEKQSQLRTEKIIADMLVIPRRSFGISI
jgi:hypothetical protein